MKTLKQVLLKTLEGVNLSIKGEELYKLFESELLTTIEEEGVCVRKQFTITKKVKSVPVSFGNKGERRHRTMYRVKTSVTQK